MTLTGFQVRALISRAGARHDSDRCCPTTYAERPAVLFRVIVGREDVRVL